MVGKQKSKALYQELKKYLKLKTSKSNISMLPEDMVINNNKIKPVKQLALGTGNRRGRSREWYFSFSKRIFYRSI